MVIFSLTQNNFKLNKSLISNTRGQAHSTRNVKPTRLIKNHEIKSFFNRTRLKNEIFEKLYSTLAKEYERLVFKVIDDSEACKTE